MDHRDFCYWLQGYFELLDDEGSEKPLTEKQVRIIKEHLSLVFTKVTSDGSEAPPPQAEPVSADEDVQTSIRDALDPYGFRKLCAGGLTDMRRDLFTWC